MNKKLLSVFFGAAILGASAAAGAQTSSKPGESGSSPTIQNQIDFKLMDKNADGMITRDEYMAYYGSRFDRMKRNDKGMVMMDDMRMWDGRSSANNPTSNVPTKARPGVKGGAGNQPATGGG